MATKKKSQNKHTTHPWIRYCLAALVVVLVVYAVATHWQQFIASLAVVRHASPWKVMAECAIYFCTVLCAALSYWVLTMTKVNFRHLLWLEWAASGMNRILPTGTGNLGMHTLYLTKHRHSLAESTAVVSVNNALGISMHLAALGALVLYMPEVVTGLHFAVPKHLLWIVGVAVIVVAVSLLTPRVQQKTAKFLAHFSRSLLAYQRAPHKLVLGALLSFSVTLCNTFVFAMALQAVGIDLSFIQGFVIYSMGVLFGAATPMPGGLGGVEAGITAGLVARGVDPTHALAGALTFRIATYWLPLIAGPIALLHVRSKKLI